MKQDTGGISGFRGCAVEPSGLAPPGFNPGRKARLFSFLVNENVRAVVASLDAEPEAWAPYYIHGRLFFLTHTTGLKLWATNRAYGLEIFAPSGRSIYGGVTMLSSIGLSIGRRVLLRAIIRWERTHPKPQQSRLPSADEILRAEQVSA